MSATEQLRKFWGESDEFKARTGLVAVYPGSQTRDDHDAQWTDEAQAPRVARLLRPLQLRTGGLVLDFGCGVGRITRQILRSGFRAVAVDVSPHMLAHAQRYCDDVPGADGVAWVLTDGYGFPTVPDACLDGLVSECVFQHLSDESQIRAAFRDIARCLKPGARCHIQHWSHGANAEAVPPGFLGIAQPETETLNRYAAAGLCLESLTRTPGIPGWFNVVAVRG